MILLFLGSWRSTLIITISIPLSILASIVCLSALGETINIMTLGGLALAVGILVDDATVTIENINFHLEQGKDVEPAILDGAHQIALPALVSTLSICIVFVPMFLLAGIAKFLFIPLAEAVVFAMLASYLLSRTLVPTLAKYWLQQHDAHASGAPRGSVRRACRGASSAASPGCASAITTLLERALHSGRASPLPFLGAMAATALLAFPLGRSCPVSARTSSRRSMPARSSCTCARAPARASRRPRRCAIRSRRRSASVIPAREIDNIVDNIGLPYSGINLAYSTSAPVGPGRCRHLRRICAGDHQPTARLRARAAREAARASIRRRPSRSCRRTSSARS